MSVLSDPTTGGVFASFAAVGDVNIAEPNALIGFAGSRVSAGTIAQELPVGFQRSEFLFDHGFIDRVVARAGAASRADRAPAPAAGARRRRIGSILTPIEPEATGFRPFSFLSSLAERVGERGGEASSPRAGRWLGGWRPAGRGVGPRPARPPPAPPADAGVRGGDDRRLRRAPRRPALRRRRRASSPAWPGSTAGGSS